MSNKGGAPKGNKNVRNGKDWQAALRHVLDTYTDDASGIARGSALRAIATTCVRQAIEGDDKARQEIACRLDGKVPQAVELKDARDSDDMNEFSDAELIAIIRSARESGTGDAPAPGGEGDTSGLH